MQTHILAVTNMVHTIFRFSPHKLRCIFPQISISFIVIFYGYIKMEIRNVVKQLPTVDHSDWLFVIIKLFLFISLYMVAFVLLVDLS